MAVENVSIRLSADAKSIDAVLNRLEAKIKRLSSKELKLTAKGSTKAVDDIAKKMSTLKSKNVDINVSAKGFDKIEQAQRRLATAQSRLQDQMARGASPTQIGSTVTQIGALQNRLNQLKSADISAPFIKASSAIGNLQSRISDLGSSLSRITFAVGALGVGVAGKLGKEVLQSAVNVEQLKTSLTVLTGSAETAGSELEKLTKLATKTPLELEDLAGAEKTLLGFGRTVSDVAGDLPMLADIAGATGADFKSLAVVFGQVNGAGRLMGQDSLQLINNNIPILNILSKKLGISMVEVKKRMEAGAISAKDFNEALKDTTKQGGIFFGGAEKQSQTLAGRISTLKDNFKALGREILGIDAQGNIAAGGIFDKLKIGVEKAVAAIEANRGKIKQFFTDLVDKVSKIDFAKVFASIKSGFDTFMNTAKVFTGIMQTIAKVVGGGDISTGMGRIAAAAIFAGPPLKLLASSFGLIKLAIAGIQWAKGIAGATQMASSMSTLGTAVSGVGKAIPILGGLLAVFGAGKWIYNKIKEANDAKVAAEKYRDSLSTLGLTAEESATKFSELSGAIGGVNDALLSLNDSNMAVQSAQTAYNEQVQKFGESSEQARQALVKLNAEKQNQIKQSSEYVAQAKKEIDTVKSFTEKDGAQVKLLDISQLEEAKKQLESVKLTIQSIEATPASVLGISEESKQKMLKDLKFGMLEMQDLVRRTDLKAILSAETGDAKAKVMEVQTLAREALKDNTLEIKTGADMEATVQKLRDAGYVISDLEKQRLINLAVSEGSVASLNSAVDQTNKIIEGIAHISGTPAVLGVNTTNLESAKLAMGEIEKKIIEITGNKDIKLDVTNPEATLTTLNSIGVLADQATRERIINILTQSGAARSDIDAIIAKLGIVPKQTNTDINVNTGNAEAKLSSLLASIRRVASSAASAASKVLGFNNGGVVPTYRSAGGIIDKPQYYANGTSFVDWKPKGKDTVPAMLTKGEGVLKTPAMSIIRRGAFNKLNSGNRSSVLAGAKEIVNNLGGNNNSVSNNSQSDNRITNNNITQEFTFNSSNNSSDTNSLWRARSILGSVI